MLNLFRKLRNYDQARASFPGEHWLVAALGTGLLRSARTRRSPLGRMLAFVAGSALLYRAASGRDGLAALGRVRGTDRPANSTR